MTLGFSKSPGPRPPRGGVAPIDGDALRDRLARLPALPGVYIFRDHRSAILYVGKAKRLDQRIRSHFQNPEAVGAKQTALVARVADVEYIAVDSEVDALLLEATLIRQLHPRYNVQLKDDKRYPCVRISWEEPYPRLTIVRRTAADGARYFGPYTEARSLRQLLRLTQPIFPLRTCSDIDAHIAARRECLDYHIGRCTGPCIGRQSREEYRAMVGRYCDFLAGRREEVIHQLKGLLGQAVERRAYERAATLRDQIASLEGFLARQRMVDVSGSSVDVIGLVRAGVAATAVILKIRERRVVSRDVRRLRGAEGASESDLLRSFLALYYAAADDPPGAILTEVEPEDRSLLEELLTRDANATVRVRAPRDAGERALVRMARRNAGLLMATSAARGRRAAEAADEALDLQRALGLERPPGRIRCFDVSHLFGTHVVASMVTFVDGAPLKSEYRRFRIREVKGQDDFASLAEATRRHAARVAALETAPADLIVIDGGMAQVAAVSRSLEGTPLEATPLVGLAKRYEEMVRIGRPPLRLPRRSAALRLLARIRDEAHRFAVEYHRTLRARSAGKSSLDSVPGLGPKKRARLLARFGSVARLRRVTVDSIASVPGIGPRLAARIMDRIGRTQDGAHDGGARA